MSVAGHQQRKQPFHEEKGINSSNHSQNLPKVLVFFCAVFIIITAVGVVMEAKNLPQQQKKKYKERPMRWNMAEYLWAGCSVSYLWYEVQEGISWEGPHCKTHKQLQDEGVGLLAGVEKDQADAEHGAHSDDQDSHRAVAILWKGTTPSGSHSQTLILDLGNCKQHFLGMCSCCIGNSRDGISEALLSRAVGIDPILFCSADSQALPSNCWMMAGQMCLKCSLEIGKWGFKAKISTSWLAEKHT